MATPTHHKPGRRAIYDVPVDRELENSDELNTIPTVRFLIPSWYLLSLGICETLLMLFLSLAALFQSK